MTFFLGSKNGTILISDIDINSRIGNNSQISKDDNQLVIVIIIQKVLNKFLMLEQQINWNS